MARACHPNDRTGKRRGMTLVEIMVATVLFTLLALTLTASYVQNLRMSKIQVYRTQAINTAVSILEQFRVEGHTDILNKYYDPTDPDPITVRLLDPTNTTVAPTGYRSFQIPFNARDDETLNASWTDTNIQIAADGATLPIRFWLTLRRDASTTEPIYDAFQVVLIYQWRTPGTSGTWETGNFRIVVPKLTVEASDAART